MYNTQTKTQTCDKSSKTIPIKSIWVYSLRAEKESLGWSRTPTGHDLCPNCKPKK
jgi:hypothetical protein